VIRRPAWLAASALVLVVALCACRGATPEDSPGAGEPVSPPVPDESIVEESTVTPLKRHTVEIYFPSVRGNGLIGEYREIFETITPGDRAKQIVADLIAGPSTSEALDAVPPGTVLRQAYMLDNGVVYLDFSPDLTERIGGGSMGEILTVYSIVDSVVANVAEIKKVGILVNGEPVETLNGHLDLRYPLPPNRSLILAPTVVHARSSGPILAANEPPHDAEDD